MATENEREREREREKEMIHDDKGRKKSIIIIFAFWPLHDRKDEFSFIYFFSYRIFCLDS